MPDAAPIMFHRFVTERSPNRPGAFTPSDLADLIDRERPINADEWCAAVLAGTTPDRTMLTFDDGLLCQYRHALPVLEYYKLQALFFIPTGPVFGEGGEWETHRWVREELFESWETFWGEFKSRAPKIDIETPASYLKNHPFYTPEERMYRWIRQRLPDLHRDVMWVLLRGLEPPRLFMNPMEVENIVTMDNQSVGSHGNAHIDPRPADGGNVHEWLSSLDVLAEHFSPVESALRTDMMFSCSRLVALARGKVSCAMSYPYGVPVAESVLPKLGIRLAFMSCPGPTDNLMRYPRRDAGVLLREMRGE